MRNFRLLLFILCYLAFFAVYNEVKSSSFCDEVARHDAVFLGEIIEIKQPSNKLNRFGDKLEPSEFKFRVEKSWKLVDKEYVWIKIAAMRPYERKFLIKGSKHIVFSELSNDVLYLSPNFKAELAQDIQGSLDCPTMQPLKISHGEYQNNDTLKYGLFILSGLIFLVIWYLFRISKKKLPKI
jgi:hypothetical protein